MLETYSPGEATLPMAPHRFRGAWADLSPRESVLNPHLHSRGNNSEALTKSLEDPPYGRNLENAKV